MHRAAAEVDGLVDGLQRPLGVGPRHAGHPDQPLVGLAEGGDGAVVGVGTAIEEVEVFALVLRGRERREHQLAVEAQQVEGPTALGRVEGAQCVPALGLHQRALEGSRRLGIATPLGGGLHRLVGQRPRATKLKRTQPFSCRRVGELLQPVGQLHQVAVRVVEHASFCVRHLGLLALRLC